MTDKEFRDSLLAKGVEVLQSDVVEKECIAVLVGPDFCSLVHAESHNQLMERLEPLVIRPCKWYRGEGEEPDCEEDECIDAGKWHDCLDYEPEES